MLTAALHYTITDKVVRRGAYAAKTCDESLELSNSGGWQPAPSRGSNAARPRRTQGFVIVLPFAFNFLAHGADCTRYN
jgi:hypothetical protein